MALTQKWPLIKRPLNLAEVLRLRNAIELSKKVLLGAPSRKSSKEQNLMVCMYLT